MKSEYPALFTTAPHPRLPLFFDEYGSLVILPFMLATAQFSDVTTTVDPSMTAYLACAKLYLLSASPAFISLTSAPASATARIWERKSVILGLTGLPSRSSLTSTPRPSSSASRP